MNTGNESNSDGKYFREYLRLEAMPNDRLGRDVRLLETTDGGDVMAWGHSHEIEAWFRNRSGDADTDRDRLLRRLKAMADRHEAKRQQERRKK